MPPRTGTSVIEAWAGAERLLQQLAAPNSTAKEWSEAGVGVQALQALAEATSPAAWPKWLLPRLFEAVARGLQPAILQMSGSQPRAAILFDASKTQSPQTAAVLYVLCAIGELMCRLSEAVHAMRRGEAPQLAMPDAEYVAVLTNKSGLLAAIGTAAGHLAPFLTTHKALKEQSGGDSAKERVAYCLAGLATGLLNLWVVLQQTLPDSTGLLVKAAADIKNTVQPIIALSATLLHAWPGPALPGEEPWRAAAAARISSARARTVPQDELTAAWVYKTQALPQVISVAAIVADAISSEVWSMAVGNPAATLKPDTPRPVLQMLQHEGTKFLFVFAVLAMAASLHEQRGGRRCLDPNAFPTSSRSSSRRARALQRQARQRMQPQPPRQQGQQQQDGKEAQQVEPWHAELEAAMGLSGCIDSLMTTEGPPQELDTLESLVAVMCCAGATLTGRGEASLGPSRGRQYSSISKQELLGPGLTQPFMKVVSELLLMVDDLKVVLFCLQLVAGVIAVIDSTQPLLRPLVAALCPHLVQGVRTADAGGGWGALEGSNMQAEDVRGTMLESATNFFLLMLDPSLIDAEAIKMVEDMLAEQPTVLLSTWEALLRWRADTEAANTVFTRRLQLYQSPPGVKLPELLRLCQQLITFSMSRFNRGEPIAASAPPAAVLRSPASAGAAWVGLLVSTQKYALRALHQAPALCAWDVVSCAVLQMLATHVVAATAADMPVIARSAAQLSYNYPVMWTEATDAAEAAGHNALRRMLLAAGPGSGSDSGDDDSSDDMSVGSGSSDIVPGMGFRLVVSSDPETEIMALRERLAQQLGPLLLPVVQLYCRSLLLLTKVLLLPAHLLSVGSAMQHPLVADYLLRSKTQLQGDAVVNAAYVAVQFLQLLLPLLRQQSQDAAGAAAADGGSSSSARAAGAGGGASSSGVRAQAAAVLTGETADKLTEQANDCYSVLHGICAELARNAKPPETHQTKSTHALLQAVQQAFAVKAPGSEGFGDGPAVLRQLQQLATDVLGALPAHKLCANPNCMALGCLSEKELSVKRCSACKTAYCSKECSRAHWKTHKPLCQRLAAAAAAAGAAAAPAEAVGAQAGTA